MATENPNKESVPESKTVDGWDAFGATPVKALQILVAPIIGMAAVAAGLCVVAYAMGWAYLSKYYETAGAAWVVDLLPVTAVMQSVSDIGMASMIFLVGGIWSTNSKATSSGQFPPVLRLLMKGGVLLAGAGALLWFFDLGLHQFLFFLAGLAIFMVFWVGFVWVLVMITEDDPVTAKTRAFGLLFFTACLGYMISGWLGEYTGKLDFTAASSKLAVVVVDADDGTNWRLVRVLPDGKMVLVKLGDLNAFRLVEADDVPAVVNPRTK